MADAQDAVKHYLQARRYVGPVSLSGVTATANANIGLRQGIAQ